MCENNGHTFLKRRIALTVIMRVTNMETNLYQHFLFVVRLYVGLEPGRVESLTYCARHTYF